MKRTYKKTSLFDRRKIGITLFSLFVVFVGYKILTPPSSELARIDSPDGTRTARLRRFFYDARPSYKVYYREKEKQVWLNLLYLSNYTNAPTPSATEKETLEWSRDSQKLYFKIGDETIWQHRFENND